MKMSTTPIHEFRRMTCLPVRQARIKAENSKRLGIFGSLTILLFCCLLFFVASSSVSASTIKAPVLNLGLVGHWTFDGNKVVNGAIFDSAGSNTGYPVSIATSTFYTDGVIGQASNFDGTNDYITIPDNSSFTFGNGTTDSPFSVCEWVKPVVLNDTPYKGVVSKGQLTTNAAEWIFYVTPAGKIGMSFYSQTSTAANFFKTSNSAVASVGTWVHVCGTYDGTGSSGVGVKFYSNGSLVASTVGNTGTYVAMNNTTASLELGVALRTSGSVIYSNGAMDDVRIYNRVLSTAEITRLYNIGRPVKISATNSTNSLASGLVGHWTFDGNKTTWTSSTAGTATDSSGSGNTGTLANMSQTVTPTDGVIGQALDFDGTNDNVNLGSSLTQVNGQSALTISGWVRLDLSLTAGGALFDKRESTSSWINFQFYTDGRIYLIPGSFSAYGYMTNSSSNLNRWANYVMVFDGTLSGNNKLKFYIDGTEQSLTYVGTLPTTTASPTATSYIGYDSQNTKFLNGGVDDVRIYSRALSTTEITRLYNMGRPTVIKTVYPLDNQNAYFAYSVRKLRTSYTGSAINVVRDSDSAASDIGFAGKNLDTTTLQNFCAGVNCYVATWYDQTGNGRNLTQTSASLRPQIVSSGVLLTGANNKPVLSFDGSNDDLRLSGISFTHPRLVSMVFQRTEAGEGGSYFFSASPQSSYTWEFSTGQNSANAIFMAGGAGTACCTISSFPNNTNVIYQTYYNGGSSIARINANSNSTGSLPAGTASYFTMGSFYQDGTTAHHQQFKVSEFVAWSGTFSQDDRDKIRNNQNEYFRVY